MCNHYSQTISLNATEHPAFNSFLDDCLPSSELYTQPSGKASLSLLLSHPYLPRTYLHALFPPALSSFRSPLSSPPSKPSHDKLKPPVKPIAHSPCLQCCQHQTLQIYSHVLVSLFLAVSSLAAVLFIYPPTLFCSPTHRQMLRCRKMSENISFSSNRSGCSHESCYPAVKLSELATGNSVSRSASLARQDHPLQERNLSALGTDDKPGRKLFEPLGRQQQRFKGTLICRCLGCFPYHAAAL